MFIKSLEACKLVCARARKRHAADGDEGAYREWCWHQTRIFGLEGRLPPKAYDQLTSMLIEAAEEQGAASIVERLKKSPPEKP